ncbi:hypothetical protein [Mucilaginibacter dorajii]|uniref:Uncharacterized protein n=1 Tax=Mucilaginibacter dorajii TaxID=692994 RepID=A0ABP7P1R2_9SPHI|nr:hypothetical protein [Mucilaginibacter dorajii]MCS3735578.1 hypothetical protein [Mucilaginibacter dorajii]
MNYTIRITWYFYKSLIIWCLLVSFFAIYYVFEGELNIALAFIVKIFGYASALGVRYLNYNSSKTNFYFRNAGYSINRLYVYTFGFDFLIFIILISLSTIR